jgi:hypothetical protein
MIGFVGAYYAKHLEVFEEIFFYRCMIELEA